MKKTQASNSQTGDTDDLRPEYRINYRKSRPNRFAGKAKDDRRVVILEPDVAAVFKTSEEVNEALRGLMESMPPKAQG